MNDYKLKKAFSQIKVDMSALNDKINLYLKRVQDTNIIEKQIRELVESIDNLKLQSEINSKLIENISSKSTSSKKEVVSDLKVDKEIEKIKSDLKELKGKKSEVRSVGIEDALNEFSEIINEKIQLELSQVKLELTDEIATIYDKCVTEIVSLKNELKEIKSQKKEKEEVVKVKEEKKVEEKKTTKKKVSKKNEDKKDSKLKKAMKWLLVDEEEDEIDSIKSEVKKSSK